MWSGITWSGITWSGITWSGPLVCVAWVTLTGTRDAASVNPVLGVDALLWFQVELKLAGKLTFRHSPSEKVLAQAGPFLRRREGQTEVVAGPRFPADPSGGGGFGCSFLFCSLVLLVLGQRRRGWLVGREVESLMFGGGGGRND